MMREGRCDGGGGYGGLLQTEDDDFLLTDGKCPIFLFK